eukprot:680840-Pleurochrysis_carterae.AAC.5
MSIDTEAEQINTEEGKRGGALVHDRRTELLEGARGGRSDRADAHVRAVRPARFRAPPASHARHTASAERGGKGEGQPKARGKHAQHR